MPIVNLAPDLLLLSATFVYFGRGDSGFPPRDYYPLPTTGLPAHHI